VALWLEFAKAYLRQGNDAAFVEVLKDGSSAEIEVRLPICLRALKPVSRAL